MSDFHTTYRKNNPEIIHAARKRTHAKTYADRKDIVLARQKVWRDSNKDLANEQTREWRQSNHYKVATYKAFARTGNPCVTPKWADMNKIKAIYDEAKEMGMIVDHVIPLKGKTVSGLHVENNLQIITPHENAVKSNKLVA